MYGLRGYRRGLGVLNYYDLLAQADLQNCDPRDVACVSNNVAKQAAVEDFWAAHQSTGVPDDTRLTFTPQTSQQVTEFSNPQDVFNSGNVVDDRGIMTVQGVPQSWIPSFASNAPAGSAPPAPTYHPAVSFNPSRAGGTLYPGDTWSIAITGGAPNSPVTVSGTSPSGTYTGTKMGTTDGNGNFTLTGQIDASQVGGWTEAWSVGGTNAGAFSFTVKPAGASGGGSGSSSGPQGSPNLSQTLKLPTNVGGFDLSSVPWWGWAGAGVAALFLLKGKH